MSHLSSAVMMKKKTLYLSTLLGLRKTKMEIALARLSLSTEAQAHVQVQTQDGVPIPKSESVSAPDVPKQEKKARSYYITWEGIRRQGDGKMGQFLFMFAGSTADRPYDKEHLREPCFHTTKALDKDLAERPDQDRETHPWREAEKLHLAAWEEFDSLAAEACSQGWLCLAL